MRAVVQGLPTHEVWDRYLRVEGTHTDARSVAGTIAWIRTELVSAARREHRAATARLLRLEVERLVDTAPSLPSLAEFAEEAGIEDESERDQLEAYQARYGRQSAKAARKGRLLKRQLEALHWLERIVARQPAAGDAIAAWLRPSLASTLERGGLFTLGQLAERINGVGRNWSRGLPAVGPVKARLIADWMKQHADSIGLPIGEHTSLARRSLADVDLAKVVSPATDIRPIEKFIVPSALDGSAGRFRRPQQDCLLAAGNDYDAILAWLRAKRGATAVCGPSGGVPRGEGEGGQGGGLQKLSHTQRAYRKEAERFLLWAVIERRKPISSMTTEDCTAYREFIADPRPAARWCGSRARPRWSPLWRPFEGPLSPAAQRQAVTILKNLYAFLGDQNYLMGNPWSGVAVPRATRPGLDVGRSLTAQQWRFVRQRAAAEGDHSTAKRLRLTLDLLYATGLRASEIVAARMRDLQAVEYPAGPGQDPVRGWMLMVVGKGQKPRDVPVPGDLVADIEAYLVERGLDPAAQSPGVGEAFVLGAASDLDERAPRLAKAIRLDPGDGLAVATLYRQLKAFFARCADALAVSGDLQGAQRLRRASTHWLRHTHASQALASGMSVEAVQHNLGHASLATTTVYVTTERSRRLAAAQAMWAAALA